MVIAFIMLLAILFLLTGHALAQTHAIDGEYIKEWLVLGPFFPDDLDTDFLVDAGGEASVLPKEGDAVTTADGRTLTWKHYESRGNVIDLLDAVGDYMHATAYAFCHLESEMEDDVEIRLCTEDGMAVWINGKQAHLFRDARWYTLDEDLFETKLKAGANCCLIKVLAFVQETFCFRAGIFDKMPLL